MLVLELVRFGDAHCTTLHRSVVDATGIVDAECDCFRSVAVKAEMGRHFRVVGFQSRAENNQNLLGW